jgi:hypothetical protein
MQGITIGMIAMLAGASIDIRCAGMCYSPGKRK